MAKQPAFQFYPGDWFREPGLKCVNLNVRGAWAELLMIMWDCDPQGEKETTLEGFSRLWRTSIPETAFIIDQLDKEKIAEVEYFDEDCKKIIQDFSKSFKNLQGQNGDMSPKCPDNFPQLSLNCPSNITIINRRMARECSTREYERLKKKEQREKKRCPGNVPSNVPSSRARLSSSSSSSTPISPLKNNTKNPVEKYQDRFTEEDNNSKWKLLKFSTT
jgi:hypothetical protein